ncbi:MAG TPA: hypothetical protein VFJ72_02550 [Rubrobacteraceae bacterium]|nr:hypothetical protein [Rubrobacteraceae bacterium]
MTTAVRNRLILLGALWGVVLAAVPALVMSRPFHLSGFLVAAVACSVVSGSVGTLVAGRRAIRPGKKRGAVAAALGTGLFQGLAGGALSAALIWALMAVTLSGFTLGNPVQLATLMSPRVFLGGFFVALSVFVYVLAGGLLLGPVFGTLINSLVRKGDA